MIRSDFDISDEDFYKVSKPFVDEIKKYIGENIIYEYMAFYIATGYKKDALFKGTLGGVFNAALDDLCELDFGSRFLIKLNAYKLLSLNCCCVSPEAFLYFFKFLARST